MCGTPKERERASVGMLTFTKSVQVCTVLIMGFEATSSHFHKLKALSLPNTYPAESFDMYDRSGLTSEDKNCPSA